MLSSSNEDCFWSESPKSYGFSQDIKKLLKCPDAGNMDGAYYEGR